MIRPFILSRFSCGYALALVLVFVTTAANGQITVGGGKTILSGQINIGADIPSVEASAFSCVTVKTLKKGEKIVGIFQIDQSGQNKIWSSSKHSFYIGSAKIVYPIAAIVPTPDKIGHTIFAANLKAKTSMKAGDKLSIDGYEIEASRPVASGESIPVLF